MKWKYKTSYFDVFQSKTLDGWLNEKGEEGWELVTIVPEQEGQLSGYYIFKKYINENS